jgi:hypothetical protein
MAMKFYGKKKVRMISLGTGETTPKTYDPATFSKTMLAGALNDLMFSTETYTSHYASKLYIGNEEKNYVRAQIESNLPMDQIGEKNVKDLSDAGLTMWEGSMDKIKPLLELMLDDVYTSTSE